MLTPPVGPGSLALGGVFLGIGSVIAVFTDTVLRVLFVREGAASDEDLSEQFAGFARLVGVDLAALGVWVVQSGI